MSLERAAERALIGALLMEPVRLAGLRQWLVPDDFDGTAEVEAFSAMCRLADHGLPPDAAAVAEEVRNHLDRPPMADAAHLGDCMEACPSPARASVYGRMVLELSIRRHVSTEAAGLRHQAMGAESRHDLQLVFGALDALRVRLVELHERENAAAGTEGPTPETVAELPALQRPQRQSDIDVEQAAILALVDQPRALATVTRWLRPGDFLDDECGALYGELMALNAAHNPIDNVTLAWRAARVGISGRLCEALASTPTTTLPPGGAVLAGRAVLEQSVRAAVVATADELSALGEPSQVNATGAAYTRLGNLWPQQRRLVQASLNDARLVP